jgi:hypothetical protein
MQEVLLKYLAGLVDSDGSISFRFHKDPRRDGYDIRLALEISQSSAVDVRGFIGKLPELTGFGSIDVTQGYNKSQHHVVRWTVCKRSHLEMLIPRLVKPMCVKAQHLQRMLATWQEKRGQLLSHDECDAIRDFSKSSRAVTGPLKPKNFPSYGWLAGYLDGNGSFRAGRRKNGMTNGQQRYDYQASVHASCHRNDAAVLEFIQKTHGGYVKPHSSNENCMIWERSLGRAHRAFAVPFLSGLVAHAHLKKHKIEQLLAFHNAATRND